MSNPSPLAGIVIMCFGGFLASPEYVSRMEQSASLPWRERQPIVGWPGAGFGGKRFADSCFRRNARPLESDEMFRVFVLFCSFTPRWALP